MSVKVLCVAGTRPNFVKVAALMRCLAEHPLFRTKGESGNERNQFSRALKLSPGL